MSLPRWNYIQVSSDHATPADNFDRFLSQAPNMRIQGTFFWSGAPDENSGQTALINIEDQLCPEGELDVQFTDFPK